MGRPHVVIALERKYAQLLGHQSRIPYPSLSLAADMAHIEAVMRLFDDTWDKSKVQPFVRSTPSRWIKKGLGMRTAFELLRQADAPLTTRQIVTQVLERLGHPKPDRDEFNKLCANFHINLSYSVGRGLVMLEGRPARWTTDLRGKQERGEVRSIEGAGR